MSGFTWWWTQPKTSVGGIWKIHTSVKVPSSCFFSSPSEGFLEQVTVSSRPLPPGKRVFFEQRGETYHLSTMYHKLLKIKSEEEISSQSPEQLLDYYFHSLESFGQNDRKIQGPDPCDVLHQPSDVTTAWVLWKIWSHKVTNANRHLPVALVQHREGGRVIQPNSIETSAEVQYVVFSMASVSHNSSGSMPKAKGMTLLEP